MLSPNGMNVKHITHNCGLIIDEVITDIENESNSDSDSDSYNYYSLYLLIFQSVFFTTLAYICLKIRTF